MKKLIFAFLTYLLLFTSQANAEVLKGKVVSVEDGDTITILTSSKQQVKIRLYGIDCPEDDL